MNTQKSNSHQNPPASRAGREKPAAGAEMPETTSADAMVDAPEEAVATASEHASPVTDADAEGEATEGTAAGEKEPEAVSLSDADPVEEIEDPTTQIATLEASLAETRDQYLRTLAEIENLRKRTEREKAEALRCGGASLARNLLGVHDAFDRLIHSIDDAFRANSAQFVNGVELIQRELLAAFEKHEIRSITPEKGDAFDPNFHQAVFKEIDEEVTTGAIVRMLESGFTLGDRLLRPATVSIADEPPTASKSDPPPLATTAMDVVEGGVAPLESDASIEGEAAI